MKSRRDTVISVRRQDSAVASNVDVHALVTKAGMYKKKIADTGSLRDTMRFLNFILHMLKAFGGEDQVLSTAWQTRNTIAWAAIKTEFVECIELLKKQRESQVSWAMLMFLYLADGMAISAHDLLASQTVKEYSSVLHKLLPFLPTAMVAVVEV
jgi:hypothetical protein